MMPYQIKPGCDYSKWNPYSSWKSFYHEESGPDGSGPSKSSQKLALWYPGVHTDWPYIALKGLYHKNDVVELLKEHYQCDDVEATVALSYIQEFLLDVESRFVDDIHRTAR